jgi:hypothetical protein
MKKGRSKMKLLYLGTEFRDAIAAVHEALDSNVELEFLNPPDLEAPFWEFNFREKVFILTDGRLVCAMQGEEVETESPGEKERVSRMRRGKSIDRTLESQ